LKVERVRHDISIGADLVQAYNEDYTAGEYKVDSRDMTQIQSRILYGMTYKNAKKTVDVNTRFGVSNQYMVSGDKQDYKINGTSVSYTGDDNSFYYTAGLGAKYYLADNTNLYVDTKYGQSSDDIQNMIIDFGFISGF
jgi:predicted porin